MFGSGMNRSMRLALLTVLLLFVGIHFGLTTTEKSYAPEKHLFIWAGPQSRTTPDFLAVVNFDEDSADYGKLITTVPLPENIGISNEPHHLGLSADSKTLAVGGLLSVLKGQPDVFFFDVSNPEKPKFTHAADPPNSAITDDFYPLPRGGFLVTMMGSHEGHHPGRVAEFDAEGKLVAEYPAVPPTDGFNPHGISVRPEINLMVTSDFILPSSTLHAVPGGLVLRGNVRVWDFKKREIVRSIPLKDPSGSIDVKLIPGDKQARAYSAGMTDDKLYLLGTKTGEVLPVFDFSTIAKGGWPQLMQMTHDGKRLFVTLNMAGKVVMFDTTDPAKPRLLKALDLGKDSGPHYLKLSHDERRLVVTDYFLNEDHMGKVQAEGDHRVHVIRVFPEDMVLDGRFRLDFDDLPGGKARPHGVALH